jgi:hypothetical protein
VKRAARLVALAGAAALGLFLCRSTARDVVLVYDLRAFPPPAGLVVRLEKDGALVREARFSSPGVQVRHAMKLTDGTYHLRYAVDRGPDGALRGERDLRISESQTIVLSLAP